MATTYSHFPIRRLLLRSNNCKELSVYAGKIMRKEKCARLFCSPAVNGAVDDEVKKSPRKKRMSPEEREEAVKSFVKQYTLMHPGKFPTLTLVREKVGGSRETLKPIFTKLEGNLKSYQDQKQLKDDDGGAVTFVDPENLARTAKSNDAIITDNTNLKQEAPLSCEKLSDVLVHDIENQASSESSKETQSFSAVSSQEQDPSESSKEGLVAESFAPSHLKGLTGTDLPDIHEQISPESLKEIPVAISATEQNLLPMSSTETASVASSFTKKLFSVSKQLKKLEEQDLRGFAFALSPELDGKKADKNTHNVVDSSVIPSILRELSAASTPKKLEVDETIRPTWQTQDSNHSINSPKVENGSDKSQNNSFLGRSASRVETSTDISILERIKQLGRDRRKKNYLFTHSFVSQNGSDDEKEDDPDFSAFDLHEPDVRDRPVIPRINFRSGKPELPEKPKNQHKLELPEKPKNQHKLELPEKPKNQHKPELPEKEDDPDFSAFDYPAPDVRGRPVIPRIYFRSGKPELPEKPKNQHKPELPEKPKNQHKPELPEKLQNQHFVQVMFLPPTATENDIHMAFNDCGSITEARIIQSKREPSKLNYASINFKTEEGFRKALTKKDVVISGGDVAVEAAFPYNQRLSQDVTPRVEENKSKSLTEIKNLGCTVMIKDLPKGLNFKHLKNALAFCGTVSSFSMGSSNSAVFVEFETEEAKERALMAHWISIDGQQLQIRRVDAPRTPVARISNVSPETRDSKILNICESFGKVKRIHRRDKDIVDMHFRQTELGCMPSILDSLNGVIMDQCHWQAQPAPVFPPETLQALWSSAEGKAYLQSVTQNLFRVISGNSFESDDMNELAAQYYGESVSTTKELR